MSGGVDVALLVRPAPGERRRLLAEIPRAAAAAASVLRRALPPLSVAVVGKARMRRINRDFHGVDEPTDVLAFDFGPSPAPLPGPRGEIVVCADVARTEARRRSLDPRGELLLYVIHGVLHLLGEEDHERQAALRMRRLEARALRKLGYDPGSAHLDDVTRAPDHTSTRRTTHDLPPSG